MNAEIRKHIIGDAKDYVVIFFGLFLYAFGFSAFIVQEKLVMGGLTGFCSLFYYKFGIPVAVMNYTLNVVMLCFAYKVVGKTFVIRTVVGATVLNLMLAILQPCFSAPLVHQQTFMNVIIGSILCGIGIGLVFVHNGSSGGTDIIAAMASKKTNVTVGRMFLYMDFCIISSSYLLFHDINKVVYGFVILVIMSFVTDLVINSNRQAVQFIIFSKKWEDIANAVNNEAGRGCTLLHGTGWYTKRDVKMLMVMCRKIEAVTIFRIVKTIDRDALIVQSNVNGVYGNGFDEVKVKLSKHKALHKDDIATVHEDDEHNPADDLNLKGEDE